MNELKTYYIETIKDRYAKFDGRARRAEYWHFCLFNFLAGVILSIIFVPLYWIYSVIVFLPGLSLTIRRLHDIGKSGWCLLLFCIPIVNIIFVFLWLCKAGDTGANQYGEDPKA